MTFAESLTEQNKILITNFCKEYTGIELASEEEMQAFIDHQKKIEIIEKLKVEMKSMKNDADNFTDQNYQTGYISAISTLEGYLAMLENGGGEDGEIN